MSVAEFNRIPEAEFAASEPVRRLITHEHARCFAYLKLADCVTPFAVSWRSDLIDPTIVVDECGSIVWVGVDDRVAAVTKDGQIQFSMSLTSTLLTILEFSRGVVAVCELAAVPIGHDFAVGSIVEFREIPESYETRGNQLAVSFMDGSTAEFEL